MAFQNSMHHEEHTVTSTPADDDKSFGDQHVRCVQAVRVVEDLARFLEAHAVLAQVRGRLRGVPFEVTKALRRRATSRPRDELLLYRAERRATSPEGRQR